MPKGRTKTPAGVKPQRETSVPVCPDYLDTIAKEEWKRITEEMLSVGLLHRVDRASLELYCETYSRYRRYVDEMRKEDFEATLPTANGAAQINPIIKLSENALKTCRLMLNQFGLTPASREKLTVKKSEDTASSKWSGLIK